MRAEQILAWMENSQDLNIQPDKYTYNTVLHCYAKAGGTEAAHNAKVLLAGMERQYQEGNIMAKPDTITVRLLQLLATHLLHQLAKSRLTPSSHLPLFLPTPVQCGDKFLS